MKIKRFVARAILVVLVGLFVLFFGGALVFVVYHDPFILILYGSIAAVVGLTMWAISNYDA